MKKNLENYSLIKQPSAWIPIVISLAALAFLVGYVAIFGITHEQMEQTKARLRASFNSL